MLATRRKIFIQLLFGLLILFAFVNPFYKEALAIYEKDLEAASKSLVLVEGLYVLAKSSTSVKLPGISGVFDAAANNLSTVSNYLSVTLVAISINLMLLKLTHFKGILLLIGILWIATFFSKKRKVLLHIMILILLINPGISLYATAMEAIDQRIHFSDRSDFHEKLALIHHDYLQKEQQKEDALQKRKAAQLKKNKAKGKDGLSRVQKAGDAIEKKADLLGGHIAEDFRLTKEAIHFAAKRLLELSVQFLSAIIFNYILIPLGYLFIVYRVASRFFGLHALMDAKLTDNRQKLD